MVFDNPCVGHVSGGSLDTRDWRWAYCFIMLVWRRVKVVVKKNLDKGKSTMERFLVSENVLLLWKNYSSSYIANFVWEINWNISKIYLPVFAVDMLIFQNVMYTVVKFMLLTWILSVSHWLLNTLSFELSDVFRGLDRSTCVFFKNIFLTHPSTTHKCIKSLHQRQIIIH